MSYFGGFFGSFPKSGYIITKVTKLDIVKTYWICGGSVTSARRILQKKNNSKFSKFDNKTTSRLVKNLETVCSLVNNTSTGRPKSALSDKNITREKIKVENSPTRLARTFSRELKLSTTSVWRILRKELKNFAYQIQIKQAQPHSPYTQCM